MSAEQRRGVRSERGQGRGRGEQSAATAGGHGVGSQLVSARGPGCHATAAATGRRRRESSSESESEETASDDSSDDDEQLHPYGAKPDLGAALAALKDDYKDGDIIRPWDPD